MRPSEGLIVSAVEPSGANRKKVWLQKGKNKFNPNDKTKGYLNTNGNFTSATDWTCSGFIEINSDKYILSANTTATRVIWCEYDSSMNIIGTRHEVVYGNPIAIVSTNTKYIKVCFNDGTATDIQLEQGTTATIYEAYVEDKFFIKNASGNYEEFMKKEGQIYSTDEQVIGTWIDGKPLYRKTIETIVNNQQQAISLDFSIDKLKKVEGGLDNGDQIIPFGFDANTNYCRVFIQKDNKTLYCMNSWGRGTLYITLEYTKTTD